MPAPDPVAPRAIVSQLLSSGFMGTGTLAKGPVTTLGGTRMLQLKVSDGATAYVTDASKPDLVEVFALKGTKDGSGKVTFTVGAPVTLTAPPASQVVDGSLLGF
jgi:hypothetical protein